MFSIYYRAVMHTLSIRIRNMLRYFLFLKSSLSEYYLPWEPPISRLRATRNSGVTEKLLWENTVPDVRKPGQVHVLI